MNRSIIASAFLAMGCIAASAVAEEAPTVQAFTQPSERRTFAFDSPGVVAEVLVKGGDLVKTGQTLMRQDSRMDRSELEVRRIDAESMVEIEAANKEAELRKVQYDRKKAGDIGYSQQEIDEAKITMELAVLKVREATQKKEQAQAVFARQKVKVEQMDLTSQVDGIVEKINVDAGEMADPQKPEGAISVVKNDPVWVEVALLETWQAARLKPGQVLDLRYTIDKPDAWHKAKVIYIAPVADASSAKQAIRLELPNPEKRASGLEVEVKLPAELTVSPIEKTAANN